METSEFETVLNAIRRNVAAAAKGTGVGLKPLATKNGMGETVIRDLVKAHNKDVQLGTLAKIAKATHTPLADLISVPGARNPISRQQLERALSDAMPGLPEASDRQVEYLVATVERVLQLPAGLRDTPGNDRNDDLDDGEEGALAPRPTK